MPDTPLTVVAFAGSLRKDSYNKMLLRALAKAAPPLIRVDILDVSDIPPYNMDLEEPDFPPAVKRLHDAIRRADGLIIVTPEHNYTMSGVTKTVIEWGSRPPDNSCLDRKPGAVMGAATGGFGTVRAQISVRQTGPETGMLFMTDPEVRVSRAAKRFNDAGELVDEDLKKELVEFLEAFARWIRQLQPKM